MTYQYGATRRVATSADRARIQALEAQLARAAAHTARLEQTIKQLEDQARRLREKRRREARKAVKRSEPTYVSTLTPEQRAHRHGDATGAARLRAAAAEAAQHKKEQP